MSSADEVRRFRMHPNLLFDVISKQAGTQGKGLLEGVQNSIDAKATRCDIELTSGGFVIRDDGHGFVDRSSIENFFEEFGHPHQEGDAYLGQFRIGRGQLFAIAATNWRSGAFFMQVDIKRRGLDYVLSETPDDVYAGCRIAGDFYEPLTPSELENSLREIKELVAFSPIPVWLNGVQVTKTETVKWDYEDDDCKIAFRTSGGLKVYNLGMFVRNYSPGQFGGCSGILVSKTRLAVNFARNDILVSQCEVWRRIRKVLDRQGGERVKKTAKRMTNDDRRWLLGRLLTVGAEAMPVAWGEKIVPVFPSGFLSMEQLSGRIYKQPLVLLGRNDNERIADAVVRAQRATVIRPEFLDWSGRESLEEVLRDIGDRAGRRGYFLDRARIVSLREAAAGITGSHSVISRSEWEPLERVAMSALQKLQWGMRNAISANGVRPREIRIGLSDASQSWTDGASFIALDRAYLSESIRSFEGIGAMLSALVHQYLFDAANTETHVVDMEFYERFHAIVSSPAFYGLQHEFIASFYKGCLAAKLSVPSQLRKSLDRLFRVASGDDDDDGPVDEGDGGSGEGGAGPDAAADEGGAGGADGDVAKQLMESVH